MPPVTYDPASPEEQDVGLPSAPLVHLSYNIVLQPPLSRRGSGPGIILILPDPNKLNVIDGDNKPLDPEPVRKWAEEGFAVIGITKTAKLDLLGSVTTALETFSTLKELDTRNKYGMIVYDPELFLVVSDIVKADPRIVSLIGYGASLAASNVMTLLHLPSSVEKPQSATNITTHSYPSASVSFVLPYSKGYEPGSAALAHSRSLVFLRKCLGGPIFDIEAIWDEHTYFEFEARSVAKTMGTMVAEPYVNHIPTMTGGVGRKNLTAFYRDHFIFVNPADAAMQTVSRTIGPDRVVDEFIYHLTHDRTVDWLLPGVPATGRKLAIPMLAVVNVRGDRLYNEHIWWDQATVLRQAGILPTHLPHPTGMGMLRLPVAGVETAHMLVDESKGKSNEMFGEEWGIHRN